MIAFPCTCGFRFEVPAELAGTPIQCPQCGRLNDVPLLSDLPNLDEDGTLRLLEDDGPETQQNREEELLRAYRPSRQDYDGTDYDLRPTFEQVLAAGVEPEVDARTGEVPAAPKYDPVTGELIEAVTLKGDEHKRVIPIEPGGSSVVGYERRRVDEGASTASFIDAPVQLLVRGGNLAVWLAVLLVHAVAFVFLVPFGFGMMPAALFALFCYVTLASHYANVVEDVGPMERDDLPAPLRGLGFWDDILGPFLRSLGALILSYVPAVAAWTALAPPVVGGTFATSPSPAAMVALGLAGFGTLLFPALFLTTSTSGTLHNLRPDRVVGTIRACGLRYLPVAVLWGVAAAVYAAGTWGTTALAIAVAGGPRARAAVTVPPFVSWPAVVAGIYLVHLFCWELGMLYRKYHLNFPWVMQRHVYTKRFERRLPSALAAARAARLGIPPKAPATPPTTPTPVAAPPATAPKRVQPL